MARPAMTMIVVALPVVTALVVKVHMATVTAALAGSTMMTACVPVLTGRLQEAHRWKVMDLLVAATTTRTVATTRLRLLTRTPPNDRTTDPLLGTSLPGSRHTLVREVVTRPVNMNGAVVTGKLYSSICLCALHRPSFAFDRPVSFAYVSSGTVLDRG